MAGQLTCLEASQGKKITLEFKGEGKSLEYSQDKSDKIWFGFLESNSGYCEEVRFYDARVEIEKESVGCWKGCNSGWHG